MLIKNEFEVAQPIDAVWEFLKDIPQLAKCLPGTELTDDLGDDKYKGGVAISMGPVKLRFAGLADITERDETAKRIVVDAEGAEVNGRGQAGMLLTAGLLPVGQGTKVAIDMDLLISGAAAQYGRGMISDVTTVLLQQFAVNMQQRIAAVQRGEDPDQIEGAAPASGFGIAVQALKMALTRVFSRFFLPYQPNPN
jgi:hypothetical protein